MFTHTYNYKRWNFSYFSLKFQSTFENFCAQSVQNFEVFEFVNFRSNRTIFFFFYYYYSKCLSKIWNVTSARMQLVLYPCVMVCSSLDVSTARVRDWPFSDSLRYPHGTSHAVQRRSILYTLIVSTLYSVCFT